VYPTQFIFGVSHLIIAMVRVKGDDALVGMATAERLLAERYPQLALSRHALRRLCMNRLLPCSALPSGRRVRYKVRIADVVSAMESLEQESI